VAVFYYDFNSPYAYLAVERIDDLIPGADWTPFAFPILLGHHGRLEQAMARDTGPVVAEVAGRLADRGMPPLVPPPSWPVESWSLEPLRAALVADEHGRLREFTRAAYRRSFAEGRLLDLDTLLQAGRDAGVPPDALSEGIHRPDIKARLKANGEQALARGVRGIPTVAVGDELFWGDDRLEEAAAAASS
jgi:2-hydroxychromene-2-carboxylate isomerase